MPTGIEWCDETWNPVTGCSKVSQGCKFCYAEVQAKRLQKMGSPRYANGFEVTLHDDVLAKPLHWTKPRRVFVTSMSDLFHEKVPDEFIDRVFAVMALCYNPTTVDKSNVITSYRQRHVFQMLTKRPERMKAYIDHLLASDGTAAHSSPFARASREVSRAEGHPAWLNAPFEAVRWVADGMPGLWLGVSVEDQRAAEERIPLLLRTPAAVRFLSCEPLLGALDLERIKFKGDTDYRINALSGLYGTSEPVTPFSFGMGSLSTIDWVIVGGESGPNARPMDEEWARSIRDQCIRANVSFFFKQWGAVTGTAGTKKRCLTGNCGSRCRLYLY